MAAQNQGGIPLDELIAAHACGRPARAPKKDPGSGAGCGRTAETDAKESAGASLRRRHHAQQGNAVACAAVNSLGR
jgi:hypothetical protein